MPWSLSHRRGDGAADVAEPTPLGENRLLKRLDANERSWLQPKKTPMARGTVVHAAGASIEHVYFPMSGMISLLAVMKTGDQIETGIIGREGVVGGSIGNDGWLSV